MNFHKPTVVFSFLCGLAGLMAWALDDHSKLQDWYLYISYGMAIGLVISIHFRSLFQGRKRDSDTEIRVFVAVLGPFVSALLLGPVLGKILGTNPNMPIRETLIAVGLLWLAIHLFIFWRFRCKTTQKSSNV